MIKMVTKRDGRVVPFDENKIMVAIGLSLKNTDLSELDIETAIHEIYYEVITVLSNLSDVSDTINVEDIQDIIESKDRKRAALPGGSFHPCIKISIRVPKEFCQ